MATMIWHNVQPGVNEDKLQGDHIALADDEQVGAAGGQRTTAGEEETS